MHPSPAPFAISDVGQASSPEKSRMLSYAGLLLDLGRGRALVRGAVDSGLSTLEFALVRLLMTHRGVAMSKTAIVAGLPGAVDPRMVDVYVSRSRAKLAAAGLDDAIKSVWGRGYLFGDAGENVPADPPTSCDLDATLVPA